MPPPPLSQIICDCYSQSIVNSDQSPQILSTGDHLGNLGSLCFPGFAFRLGEESYFTLKESLELQKALKFIEGENANI
ncbi:MAG: hypothetical protein HC920_19460 [Oscillatoriales cyanobacterium SM2_3_0]|nr:hypothetical protein [Oscillatoriales cyanobacterium SM2_3_0]